MSTLTTLRALAEKDGVRDDLRGFNRDSFDMTGLFDTCDFIVALVNAWPQLDAALTAAEALADRLDAIVAHPPRYQSVLAMAILHGNAYHGPTWDEPLKALRAAVAALGRLGEGE